MQKHWSDFYTPKSTAKELMNLIPSKRIRKIGDICAGSGNLLDAAHNRWPKANFLAIDINSEVLSLSKKRSYKITTRCSDATDWKRMISYFNRSKYFSGGCDLIVANPPFGYFKPDRDVNHTIATPLTFSILYEEAIRLGRIEAYMLLSNILSLKEGGTFAAVLPESLFSSEKWKKYRDILLNYYFDVIHISKTQQVFRGSDVRTRNFIGIKKKGLSFEDVTSKNVEKANEIDIVRGAALSSITSKRGTFSVFHTDAFNSMANSKPHKARARLAKKDNKYSKEAILRKGDVVVVRVAKNAGAAEIVTNEYVGWHVSDCIMIVRHPKWSPVVVCKVLNDKLSYKRKGLAAQYITRNDIIVALT